MKQRVVVGLMMVVVAGGTAIVLSGCSTCGSKDAPTRYLTDEKRDYALFKPGTYWVYQNDSTQQTDSLAIISDSSGTFKEMELYEEHCEMIHDYVQFVRSVTSKNSSGISFSYYASGYTPVLFEKDSLSYRKGSVAIYLDSESRSSEEDTLYDLIALMTLNGNHFQDVFEMKYAHGWIDNGKKGNYYSARNFGIIKKEILDSTGSVESWSLLRYHIVQ